MAAQTVPGWTYGCLGIITCILACSLVFPAFKSWEQGWAQSHTHNYNHAYLSPGFGALLLSHSKEAYYNKTCCSRYKDDKYVHLDTTLKAILQSYYVRPILGYVQSNVHAV